MATGHVQPQVLPFRRAREGKMLGGVAAGLAQHLRQRPLVVRLWLVGLCALGGFGAVLYAALWIVVRQTQSAAAAPPGLAAADRLGLRPRRWRERVGDMGQQTALAMLAIGLLVLAQGLGIGLSPRLFWPAVVMGAGLVLVWMQTDVAERRDWTRTRGAPFAASLFHADGKRAIARIAAGIVVVLVGIVAYVATSVRPSELSRVLAAVVVVVVGLSLIIGPWLLGLLRQLGDERSERILSQERADVAAHLHDSVLQTLALIQRQADEPREVVRLARSQERDLRSWLYESPASSDSSLRVALERTAAEVEEHYSVPIDVVTVGDCEGDPRMATIAKAAREAMVNASKHAKAARVDVFAEVDDDEVAVFIRDRGVGFDKSLVPDDRLGVRSSIVERMHRHGGTAAVHSEPGLGTEVRLRMPRIAAPGSRDGQFGRDRTTSNGNDE